MHGLGLPAGCHHSAPAPDTTKVSRSGRSTNSWTLEYSVSRQEIAVVVAQIPHPYFMTTWTLIMSPVRTLTLIPFSSPPPPPHLYRCITVSVPFLEELWGGSFWNVLPWLQLLKYTNHVRSVNQKWKVIRWDIEYVPLHNSSADCMGSYGSAGLVTHCPLQTQRRNIHLSALQPLWHHYSLDHHFKKEQNGSVYRPSLKELSGQLPLNWAVKV